MKILVFTDIHGNYEILKELFNTEDFKQADLRICLGDCIDLDMQNNECLHLLKESQCICTYGNYEARLFDWFNEPSKNLEKFIQKNKEIKESLDEQSLNILNSFTKEFTLNICKTFKFCHYKWANDKELVIREEPTYNHITSIYKNDDYDFIICGHDHNSYNYIENNKQIICIGSLGFKCPAPYLTINVNIDTETFKKLNPNYIEYCNHSNIEVMPNSNLKTSFDKSKILYEDNDIKITLKYLKYNLDALKNIYNTPKFHKRNFELKFSHN